MYKIDFKGMKSIDAAAPAPQTHVVGDNQPRYTTKRLHDEIAKARAALTTDGRP